MQKTIFNQEHQGLDVPTALTFTPAAIKKIRKELQVEEKNLTAREFYERYFGKDYIFTCNSGHRYEPGIETNDTCAECHAGMQEFFVFTDLSVELSSDPRITFMSGQCGLIFNEIEKIAYESFDNGQTKFDVIYIKDYTAPFAYSLFAFKLDSRGDEETEMGIVTAPWNRFCSFKVFQCPACKAKLYATSGSTDRILLCGCEREKHRLVEAE